MYFVHSDIFLEFFFRNFPEIFCFYFSLLILKFYFIFHFLINFTSYLIISFHHLILTGDLNSDSESDDSDDDDYNPEKEKMENQDNNDISDQGYDTDELSEEESDDNHNSNDVDEDNQREKSEDDDYYKFKQNNLMERDKKKTNRNEEDDEGNNNDRKKHGIEEEKEEEKEEGNGHDDNESDLEDDIDAEELNDLLHEAGSTLVPSGSMSVGGRLLRQRSSADREDRLT